MTGELNPKSTKGIDDSVNYCPSCGEKIDDTKTNEAFLHEECGKGFRITRLQ